MYSRALQSTVFTVLIWAMPSGLIAFTNEEIRVQEASLFQLNSHATTPTAYARAIVLSDQLKVRYGPTFWTSVINDGTYPLWQRRMAMEQLFLRNGKHCALSEFVKLPGATTWFDRDNISLVSRSERVRQMTKNGFKGGEYYSLQIKGPKNIRFGIIIHVLTLTSPYFSEEDNPQKDCFARAMTGTGDGRNIVILESESYKPNTSETR